LFDGEVQGGVACFGLGFVVGEKGDGVVSLLVLILMTPVSRVHVLEQGTEHLMVIIQNERPNSRAQLPFLQFGAIAQGGHAGLKHRGGGSGGRGSKIRL
jgi:hypothetical protein